MAQGDFTKQEGQQVYEILNELFEGLPKARRMEYLGHLNDIGLFIAAAVKHASWRAARERRVANAGCTG